MDFKAEIDDLKRRVGDLEGAVNVLAGQFSKVYPELLVLKQETADGFQRMGAATESVIARADTLNTQIWRLRDDLPGMICEAIARSPSRPERG